MQNLNNEFKNKFKEIYRNKILPLSIIAEERRKSEFLKSFLISCLASLPYLLPVGFALFMLRSLGIDQVIQEPLYIFSLLPIILASVVISLKLKDYSFIAQNKKYKSFFKSLILSEDVLEELNIKPLECIVVPTLSMLEFLKNEKLSDISNELNLLFDAPDFSYEYASLIRKSGLFDDTENIDVDDSYQGEYANVQYTLFDLRTKSMCGFNMFVPTQKACVIIFDLADSIKNKTIIKCKTFKNLLKRFSSFMHDKDSFFPFVFLQLFISIVICYVVFFSNCLQELCKDLLMDLFFNFLGWLSVIIAIISIIYIISHLVMNILTVVKRDMPLMKLEDLKFNNMYITTTNNQVEGRYRVTPAFMERLMKLKTSFVAKNISASFYNDTLIVRLDTQKDLFEIGDLWHPLTDRKYAEDFYNEMSSIIRMIEYFKLDEKTGL